MIWVSRLLLMLERASSLALERQGRGKFAHEGFGVIVAIEIASLNLTLKLQMEFLVTQERGMDQKT